MQNYDANSLFPTFSVIEGLAPPNAMTDTHTDSNERTYLKLEETQTDSDKRYKKIYELSNDMDDNIANDILDNDGNLKRQGRLVDVARQDIQVMLIEQNTLYMIGTITIATLLITAILISK
jgi:hypothetical protein